MKEGAAEREDQPGEAAASFPATVAGPSHGVEPGLVEIAVGLPVRGTFTYRLTEKTGPLSAGCRVLVPFGRRRVTGYLLGAASCEPPEAETKEVLAPLDAVPLLARDVLSLCRFAAGYYLYPLGEAMRTALPPGINVSSERRARLTETGRAALASGEDASSGVGVDVRARAALERVAGAGAAGLRVGRRKGWLSGSLAERLHRAGLVTIETPVERARVRARTVERLTSTVSAEDLEAALKSLGRAKLQAAVLEWLVARGAVLADELRAAFPGGGRALAGLVDKGLVGRESLRADRSPGGVESQAVLAGDEGIPDLTPDQKEALISMRAALGGGFSPFLLQGVTGSGKTEVYLRLIEEAQGRGMGALVLVPEIALTPQLAGRFRSRFGSSVAVLHSGLTEGERHDEWWRLRRGEARVAVGVRSAVFAPVDELGVVVVDEEHDGSFKQEDGFRYHARDLALVRAREAGALAVLGSATPSLESVENARRGRYELLRLPSRVKGRRLPVVGAIDLRREPPRPAGPDEEVARGGGEEQGQWLLSDRLVTALSETLSSGNQAILFLNRRGHTPSLICEFCGEPARCKSCDVGLTLHRAPRRMLCHYCGYSRPPPDSCINCGFDLRPLGVGTQRIEEEIERRLPSARVSRLDRDTTARRGALAGLLADFALGRSDILVGTQMVAKGHDFPGVTLVGVVLADTGLSFPDFRASERTFQLLAQVSGRAGRGSDPGRVLIQSWRPEHPAVRMAVEGDFDQFAESELESRRRGPWPPYVRLLMARVEGKRADRVEAAAAKVARRAEAAAVAHPEAELEVLGPAPAPLAFLRGRTRHQVLIKAPSVAIVGWLGRELQRVEAEPGVDIALDVDPVGML